MKQGTVYNMRIRSRDLQADVMLSISYHDQVSNVAYLEEAILKGPKNLLHVKIHTLV